MLSFISDYFCLLLYGDIRTAYWLFMLAIFLALVYAYVYMCACDKHIVFKLHEELLPFNVFFMSMLLSM